MSFHKTALFLFFLTTLLSGFFWTVLAESPSGLSTEIEDLSLDSNPEGNLPSMDVSAEDALIILKEGNHKYATVTFKNRVASTEKREFPLSQNHNPHSVILSCSDSRAPPTLIFDQGLGDIFVVRDAGEVPGISVLASIEYAVKHLGARLIVVMGHTDCGAIKAALSSTSDQASESPNIEAMITEIRNNLGGITLKSASPHFKAEAFLNAKEVAKNLIKRSNIIRKQLQKGDLIIIPALYDLRDGTVQFADEERITGNQEACSP